jgi:hypothetical protein
MRDSVDTFLDELIARLDRGESAGLGPAPVFTGARRRPGYRKADVGALLITHPWGNSLSRGREELTR